MVFITRIVFAKARKPMRNYLKAGFRDSLYIRAVGGTGGNGLPKFGGMGGRGGDVKVVGKEGISLHDVFKRNRSKSYVAKKGRHSTHNFILGTPGESLRIEVPVGVTILSEEGEQVGEINKEGEEAVIAEGGVGGGPKNKFIGRKGQIKPVMLDLKLIADIGLVGFPNAGKSTLLRAISKAKPKVADYPFTTIRPNLGIITYDDYRQISMADLPGLIEGAYNNRGMGHNFLKHVERTKLVLLVVDINGFQLGPLYSHRSCIETVLLLNRELELYNNTFLDKPSMLLINKMDEEGAQAKYDEIKDKLKHLPEVLDDFPENMRPEKVLKFSSIMAISAKESPEDVERVKRRLRVLLDVVEELEKTDEDDDAADWYTRIREKATEVGPKLV